MHYEIPPRCVFPYVYLKWTKNLEFLSGKPQPSCVHLKRKGFALFNVGSISRNSW